MEEEKKNVTTDNENANATAPTNAEDKATDNANAPAPETAKNDGKEVVKKEEKCDGKCDADTDNDDGNAIPLSEVVLKAELNALVKEQIELYTKDVIASLQSKVDAVVKENEDLKNSLAEAKGESDNLRKKYEDNGDFGVPQSKSQLNGSTKSGNSNYVSYEDMWNGKTEFDK